MGMKPIAWYKKRKLSIMKRYAFDYRRKRDVADAATIELQTEDSLEVVEINQSSDTTVKLHSDATPVPGDRVILKLSSDGTARTTSFGSGFTGPNVSGAVNKIKVVEFVHDGDNFIAVSAAVQID